MNYEQLTEMAAQVEEHGFSDVKDDAILKVAESSELLRKLDQEIKDKKIKDGSKKSKKGTKKESKKKSGTQLIEGMFAFKKEASKTRLFSNKIIDGIAQTALVGLGISVAGRMMDNAEKGWDKREFNNKKRALVGFAKRENPSLVEVPNSRIGRYLDSAYVVSPKIAKDPLIATAYINTAHAVGGADLGTMKTLSDIQSHGGQSYTSNYDAMNSVSGDLVAQARIANPTAGKSKK